MEFDVKIDSGSAGPAGGEETNAAEEKLDQHVMVIAPVGGDATAIATLFSANGFPVSICEDPAKNAAEIVRAGALVMTEEVLEFATTGELLSALKEQPPWSELPVIILTSGDTSRLSK